MDKIQKTSKIRCAIFFHFSFVFDTINTVMDGIKEVIVNTIIVGSKTG